MADTKERKTRRRRQVYNSEQIGQHMDNMRRRYLLRERRRKVPDQACAKCGSMAWNIDTAGCMCFICGAHGHFEGDNFVQQ